MLAEQPVRARSRPSSKAVLIYYFDRDLAKIHTVAPGRHRLPPRAMLAAPICGVAYWPIVSGAVWKAFGTKMQSYTPSICSPSRTGTEMELVISWDSPGN